MKSSLQPEILNWDIKSWSKALNFWEEKVNWNKVNRCLEIGGREGGLSLWLALKGKQVVCSDLNKVKETALPLHKKHNVHSLITYEDINALEIPYENHFDLIVLKSVLGGIGSNDNFRKQELAIKQILKALKPGGCFLFAENLSASPIHQFFRKKFVKWGERWRYVSMSEMKYLLHDFQEVELKTNGFFATFGRSEKQREVLASLDNVIHPLIPEKWNYIVYGTAKKP